MTPLDLAQHFHRAGILRDHFKQVPDDYLAFPDERKRDVKIRCVCGTEIDLRKGQLASCTCGRIFWNGKTKVYAAAPPEPDDHVCEPELLPLPSGKVAIADYCAVCKADIVG